MAKLSAHGAEIGRYFSPRYRRLIAVMADGVLLARTVHSGGWRLFSRKKPDVPLDEWRKRKLEMIANLPAWARECKSLPSIATLEHWMMDGICESISGDSVEPDGLGPDGAPSWLLALGLI